MYTYYHSKDYKRKIENPSYRPPKSKVCVPQCLPEMVKQDLDKVVLREAYGGAVHGTIRVLREEAILFRWTFNEF